MDKNFLYLNSRDEFYKIDFLKIVYFEADGNYTNIVLSNNVKGVVCVNLNHMQQLLIENLQEKACIFARIGKRFVINLNYVYHIEVLKQKLSLTDGVNFIYQLPISKDALKKLKDMYVVSLKRNTEKVIDNNK